MAKIIIWSSDSENDFSDILDYLERNWNKTVALRFIDLVDLATSTNFHKPNLISNNQ